MIEGTVRETFVVGRKLIVSVTCADNVLDTFKIGQEVTFDDIGPCVISGIKFWSEKHFVDLMFDAYKKAPKVGVRLRFNEQT